MVPTLQSNETYKPDSEYVAEFTAWLMTDPFYVPPANLREFLSVLRRTDYPDAEDWASLAQHMLIRPHFLWCCRQPRLVRAVAFRVSQIAKTFREPWSTSDRVLHLWMACFFLCGLYILFFGRLSLFNVVPGAVELRIPGAVQHHTKKDSYPNGA